jgi:predicted ferric reductase
MKPGQKVYVDGPFGHFSIDRHPHAEVFIFIAGGVGITPMMSMLRTLAQRGDKRAVTLIYASRDWESVIFREEIEQLQDSLNLKLVHVIEKPPENWVGEIGFINQSILEHHLPEARYKNAFEVFICGPPPMMRAVEKGLSNMGIHFGDFHSEQFSLV